MKAIVARLYRSLDAYLVDHARNPLLRFVAVGFALLDMRREALSVVWGRHHSRRREARAALTSLRRDVHRVEKGLIMRPRRVPFGKDYVPGLVTSLRHHIDQNAIPEADLAWANDVLRMYFEVTSGVTEDWLANARTQFAQLVSDETTATFVPSQRAKTVMSSIKIEDLEQLATQRRSVRWFDQAPVSPTTVDYAFRIAAQAPSACNRQNIRYHMVYGQDQTAPILATVGGTRGFGHQVPAVAVLIGRLAGYRYGFDRHAIYVDGGLSTMSFLLGLETLGLSSCCINWPDVGSRRAALNKLVPLEDDEQVIMLIAIGRADPVGLIPSSHKRSLAALRSA